MTHSGAKKRFSVTKTGKIKMSSMNRRHDIKGCKTPKRKRQLRKAPAMPVPPLRRSSSGSSPINKIDRRLLIRWLVIKGAMMTRKRRKKAIKLAKGYWGSKKNHYKLANEQVMKSLKYAYVGRKLKSNTRNEPKNRA